jgi:hypothetical protein
LEKATERQIVSYWSKEHPSFLLAQTGAVFGFWKLLLPTQRLSCAILWIEVTPLNLEKFILKTGVNKSVCASVYLSFGSMITRQWCPVKNCGWSCTIFEMAETFGYEFLRYRYI